MQQYHKWPTVRSASRAYRGFAARLRVKGKASGSSRHRQITNQREKRKIQSSSERYEVVSPTDVATLRAGCDCSLVCSQLDLRQENNRRRVSRGEGQSARKVSSCSPRWLVALRLEQGRWMSTGHRRAGKRSAGSCDRGWAARTATE